MPRVNSLLEGVPRPVKEIVPLGLRHRLKMSLLAAEKRVRQRRRSRARQRGSGDAGSHGPRPAADRSVGVLEERLTAAISDISIQLTDGVWQDQASALDGIDDRLKAIEAALVRLTNEVASLKVDERDA